MGITFEVLEQLDEKVALAWDRLLIADAQREAGQHTTGGQHRIALAQTNPFVRSAWLRQLEQSGSVGPGTGWQVAHLVLRDTASASLEYLAALPLYLKSHSYGEYVFDWAWADAYERAGLPYYPKLLSAVPFTPVPGPRVLFREASHAQQLVDELIRLAKSNRFSSVHLLLGRQSEKNLLDSKIWLTRSNVQFHWINQNWKTFDDFLQSLIQPKRKKIRAERRKFQDTGLRCERLTSDQLTPEDWQFFYQCYCATYAAHHSIPYLTEAFFCGASRDQGLPPLSQMVDCLMVKVLDGDRPIAASLCIYDDEALYGRYWGCIESVPFVHFEASYYQPLEFAIERGLKRFEGGAQGEHKMARGFSPVATRSMHWLAHPQFHDAIERFLAREQQGIRAYENELLDRNPFKAVSQ